MMGKEKMRKYRYREGRQGGKGERPRLRGTGGEEMMAKDKCRNPLRGQVRRGKNGKTVRKKAFVRT